LFSPPSAVATGGGYYPRWNYTKKPWAVYLKVDGKTKHVGYYATEEEAKVAFTTALEASQSNKVASDQEVSLSLATGGRRRRAIKCLVFILIRKGFLRKK